ncbi:MAG TPA: hypothetical protein VGZ69_03740 [Candidatus Rhabdochlamydia sp.]|jgi:tetratricopeptide (TPR) repeat protein|nr:hypothetical protein [Candidatus Rhabdochlamydia sp.]
MSIRISNEFNNDGVLNTSSRRFWTLNRWSKNRFSLSFKNIVTQKTESILTTGTLERSFSNTEKYPPSRNCQTLERGRIERCGESLGNAESALEQAIKKFSDDGISNKYANFSAKTHSQEDTSFVKTLRRNVSIRLLNLKKPEEINKYLEKAKKYFQVTKYKESKKLFEKLLGSEHLKSEEKISETSLYLAAIYLLEGNGAEAKKYLEGVTHPYLKLVMRNHAKHLIDQRTKKEKLKDSKEYKEIPFPSASAYEIEWSGDEKIVVEKLLKSFEGNTPKACSK